MIQSKGTIHKRWKILGFLFLIGIMGLNGCIQQIGPLPFDGGDYASEEFLQTYSVNPGTVLKVFNQNGAITVTSWENEQVEVYAFKDTQYGQDELDKVSIEVSTGNEMTVKSQFSSVGTIRVSVTYEIKVPAGVRVERLESTNGALNLMGTTGDAMLVTSNGPISVKDVDGWIWARSSNGAIEIKNVKGVRNVDTSNGRITVEIPAIKTDITIESSNGDIYVYVAEDLDADIIITTANGRISVQDIQLTLTEISTTRVEGTLGNGGYVLDIHTSNGDISLFQLG